MKIIIFSLCLWFWLPFANAKTVRAVGLFSDKAMVIIDGKRRVLSVNGKSVDGVRLIKSDSTHAVVEINGIRKALYLRRDMGAGIQEPEKKRVRINRNNRGEYLSRGLINNKSVEVLLDTGANVVALSSREADRLGLDYKNGKEVRVTTASSTVTGYRVLLTMVSLGGIQVNNVEATVLSGDYPETVLLGTSYLKHVKMIEEAGVMQLEANY